MQALSWFAWLIMICYIFSTKKLMLKDKQRLSMFLKQRTFINKGTEHTLGKLLLKYGEMVGIRFLMHLSCAHLFVWVSGAWIMKETLYTNIWKVIKVYLSSPKIAKWKNASISSNSNWGGEFNWRGSPEYPLSCLLSDYWNCNYIQDNYCGVFVFKDWVDHRSFSAVLGQPLNRWSWGVGQARAFTIVVMLILSGKELGIV